MEREIIQQQIAIEDARQAEHGANASKLRGMYCDNYSKYKKGTEVSVIRKTGRVIMHCVISGVFMRTHSARTTGMPDCADDPEFCYTIHQKRTNSRPVQIHLRSGDKIARVAT